MSSRTPEEFRERYKGASVEELKRVRRRVARDWKLEVIDELIEAKRPASRTERQGRNAMLITVITFMLGSALAVGLAMWTKANG